MAEVPGAAHWSPNKRWNHVQLTLDKFGARFCKELLPHYPPLNTWCRPQQDFKPGDLVLYLDQKLKGRWPLARVEAIHRSKADYRVRSVIIKFNGKLYERSVHKLLRLEQAM